MPSNEWLEFLCRRGPGGMFFFSGCRKVRERPDPLRAFFLVEIDRRVATEVSREVFNVLAGIGKAHEEARSSEMMGVYSKFLSRSRIAALLADLRVMPWAGLEKPDGRVMRLKKLCLLFGVWPIDTQVAQPSKHELRVEWYLFIFAEMEASPDGPT